MLDRMLSKHNYAAASHAATTLQVTAPDPLHCATTASAARLAALLPSHHHSVRPFPSIEPQPDPSHARCPLTSQCHADLVAFPRCRTRSTGMGCIASKESVYAAGTDVINSTNDINIETELRAEIEKLRTETETLRTEIETLRARQPAAVGAASAWEPFEALL